MKSETMPKKKKSYLSRLGMTLLTILLIVLFIFIMSLVSKIQGTARVVNYAGLVRGKTQRIIKLEISGSPQDEMIADIDAFIDGLENGSSQLNLVRLDDPDFQAKMKELDAYFSQLKEGVALHGGTVAVTSAPGRGTTFTVTLPEHHGKEEK